MGRGRDKGGEWGGEWGGEAIHYIECNSQEICTIVIIHKREIRMNEYGTSYRQKSIGKTTDETHCQSKTEQLIIKKNDGSQHRFKI